MPWGILYKQTQKEKIFSWKFSLQLANFDTLKFSCKDLLSAAAFAIQFYCFWRHKIN